MREKPGMLMPALYGGLVMGILVGVPYLNFVNCACCAGIILGGFLSVFFYKKDFLPDMPPLESGDALKLGALSGVVGGVFGTMLSHFFQLFTHQNIKEEIDRSMEQFRGQEAEAFVRMLAGLFDSPFFIFLALLFSIFFCVIFGLIGGLIGYAVFKPKQQMMNAMPPQPPTQMS